LTQFVKQTPRLRTEIIQNKLGEWFSPPKQQETEIRNGFPVRNNTKQIWEMKFTPANDTKQNWEMILPTETTENRN